MQHVVREKGAFSTREKAGVGKRMAKPRKEEREAKDVTGVPDLA